MIVYEFDLNNSEKVRISMEDFKGKRLIYICIYENFQDGKGYNPTKKEISLDLNQLSELRKGIDRLFAKVEFEKNK